MNRRKRCNHDYNITGFGINAVAKCTRCDRYKVWPAVGSMETR